MLRLALASLALAVAVPLAACGGDGASSAGGDGAALAATETAMTSTATAATRDADDATAARRRARRGRTIRVVASQFGPVIADIAGEALYLFDAEESSRPECYGQCAAAWPPVLAKGVPVAGRGVRKRWLGTTRRRGGRVQVTYRGRPLYYYVHDAPGRILCHDVFEFGGTWLVVAPNGRARS